MILGPHVEEHWLKEVQETPVVKKLIPALPSFLRVLVQMGKSFLSRVVDLWTEGCCINLFIFQSDLWLMDQFISEIIKGFLGGSLFSEKPFWVWVWLS